MENESLNPLNWLRSFLNWLIKIKPRYLIALSFVCFVILFIPKNWQKNLGCDQLIIEYKGWISLIGIATGLYAFALIIANFMDFIWEKIKEWYWILNAPKIIKGLSRQEKTYLAKYVKKMFLL